MRNFSIITKGGKGGSYVIQINSSPTEHHLL